MDEAGGLAGDGPRHVAELRRHYRLAGMSEADVAAEPMQQFDRWFAEAVASMDEAGFPEPNAMVVATTPPDGQPSTRMVLLKGYDEHGFVFYTNYHSRKAREITTNPHVSLHFPWLVLQRQVVVTGRAARTSREETDAYFRTRPYGSRIGAWASPQSQVVPNRAALEAAYAAAELRFPETGDVPPPEHWGGYRVVPDTVEFWQGRPNRLHDRLRYRRQGEAWVLERLAP